MSAHAQQLADSSHATKFVCVWLELFGNKLKTNVEVTLEKRWHCDADLRSLMTMIFQRSKNTATTDKRWFWRQISTCDSGDNYQLWANVLLLSGETLTLWLLFILVEGKFVFPTLRNWFSSSSISPRCWVYGNTRWQNWEMRVRTRLKLPETHGVQQKTVKILPLLWSEIKLQLLVWWSGEPSHTTVHLP